MLWLMPAMLYSQQTFYKQFEGKINGREVRLTLIKADSRDSQEYNLRGEYYYRNIGKILQLVNGTLDSQGNLYIEEGYYKPDRDMNGQAVFIKSGVLMGIYYADRSVIEGTWVSANARQNFPFKLQEDYSNGSIQADIIFNDTNYEDAQIRFHYPKLKNNPAAAKVNQFIQSKLLGNMPKQISDFLNNYKEAQQTGGMLESYESSNIAYIILNENNLLTLQYNQFNYTGGAHGLDTHSFYVFNLRNGEPINIADLFNVGYEPELTKIAEQTLRANFRIPANQSLAQFGFTLQNGKFTLAKNYYVRREGVGFYYNPYEIAPYAVGSVELLLPFERIKHLIKKEGLLKGFAE